VPTLRRKLVALSGAVAMMSAVLLLGGVAHAQSYPPGTTVPTCSPSNQNKGTVAVGAVVTFTLCGPFAPGPLVNVTVNGVDVFTKHATNGAVVVVVTVTSQTVLSVDDPVNVAAICGVNTAVAKGTLVDGTPGTSTGTFTLTCTSATTGGTTSSTTSSGLAFTGANIIEALLVAFGLIVIGALLVAFQRRRRQGI
jgi:hypothetical protein